MAESDTYHRLLDTAVQLFAQRGFEGTSVRDITGAAKANQASIHYHFGSKEAMLRAATGRIVEPLNRRRIELIDELEAETEGSPTSDQLLRIFLQADIETLQNISDRGASARFLGRVYGDPSPDVQAMAAEQFGVTAARFIPAFAAALPELSDEELRWRIEQVVAVIINLFARWPATGMSSSEAAATLDRLVSFLGPGLRAPPI